MTSHMSYLRATRHPWPSLLFVLPLVIAYEAGVAVLGGPHPEHLRNGADNWLRVGLTHLGISWVWLPPAVLLALMAVWTWKRRYERPNEVIAILSGMILESVAYAIGLWGVSRRWGRYWNSSVSSWRPAPRSRRWDRSSRTWAREFTKRHYFASCSFRAWCVCCVWWM